MSLLLEETGLELWVEQDHLPDMVIVFPDDTLLGANEQAHAEMAIPPTTIKAFGGLAAEQALLPPDHETDVIVDDIEAELQALLAETEKFQIAPSNSLADTEAGSSKSKLQETLEDEYADFKAMLAQAPTEDDSEAYFASIRAIIDDATAMQNIAKVWDMIDIIREMACNHDHLEEIAQEMDKTARELETDQEKDKKCTHCEKGATACTCKKKWAWLGSLPILHT